MNILINGLTEAKTIYTDFSSFEGNEQIAFFATGLSVGEEIGIEFTINGTNWEALKQYGVTVKLSSTNNAIGVYCPARIRLVKPSTANNVYVGISTKDTNVHIGS